MRLADLGGVAGATLAVVALAQAAGRRRGLGRTGLLAAGALGLLVALLPVDGLPLAGWLRGVIGDLSVTTLLLLGRFVLRPALQWGPLDGRTRVTIQALLVGAGLVLYPLTLGFSPWDPYRLGYGSPFLLAVLFVTALVALLSGRPFVAAALSLGVLCWSLGMSESRNLWDALMDPLVFVWAALGLVQHGRQRPVRDTGGGLRKTSESTT